MGFEAPWRCSAGLSTGAVECDGVRRGWRRGEGRNERSGGGQRADQDHSHHRLASANTIDTNSFCDSFFSAFQFNLLAIRCGYNFPLAATFSLRKQASSNRAPMNVTIHPSTPFSSFHHLFTSPFHPTKPVAPHQTKSQFRSSTKSLHSTLHQS